MTELLWKLVTGHPGDIKRPVMSLNQTALDNYVHDNLISDCGGSGVKLQGTPGNVCRNNTVTDNAVDGSLAVMGGQAVIEDIAGYTDSNVIRGNTFGNSR